MKGGGGGIRIASESSQPVSPVAAAELLSRQVSIHDPQTALKKALARLPAGANGAVTDEFAVATEKGSAADAQAIGRCLKRYATALNAEFQIDSPTTMVTAYAVPSSY